MVPLLCLAAMLFFGYCLGFGANKADWDAMQGFRISVLERHFRLEIQVTELQRQVSDLETRLELEHEMRRELEQKFNGK